jgi:hypothetical protein
MAGMHSSAYAPPLNYNQPTEVVGGYDAQINPMTGQEIPQTNFAGGGLASLVASPYRDSDVMQVKMTPREVAGLQQLAMSYGAMPEDLYDPVTGQPQFSFLKKLLPTIIGATLNTFAPGVGSKVGSLFGLSGTAASTIGTGLVVGGAYGLIEGDLKKGLQAGLGAYSGANIAQSLQASAMPAPVRPGAEEMAKVRTEMGLRDLDKVLENTGMTEAATQAAMPSNGLDYFKSANVFRGTPTAIDLAAGRQGIARDMSFGGIGQGVKNLFTSPESRTAFGQAMGGGFESPFMQYIAKTATYGGLANALTPAPKKLPMGGAGSENVVYIPGAFNPLYGTGRDQPYQLPGKYYKKTPQGLVPYNPFAMAPGYAEGGEIEGYADGGEVGVAPPRDPMFAQLGVDPNVAATRAYIEDLNRRARNPVVSAYPGTGGGFYGTPFDPSNFPSTPGGGGVGGGGGGGGSLTGSPAGDLIAGVGGQYLAQKGIEKGIGYLKDKFTTDPEEQLQKDLDAEVASNPDLLSPAAINASLAASNFMPPDAPLRGGNMFIEDATSFDEAAGEYVTRDELARRNLTRGRELTDPLANPNALAALSTAPGLASGLASLGRAGGIAADGTGVVVSTARMSDAAKTAYDVAYNAALPEGVAAAEVAGEAAANATSKGIFGLTKGAPPTGANMIIPGLQTVLGLHQAYEGIRKGNEVQSALGGFGAATGAASLMGYSGLAALGPIGLAAAAVAALGSSMVNTKEYGDKALENYWKAVDQGRGFGSAPPEELAQGFINFYRTNKNEFPGQAKYGRTGNEDFVYDMTQVINKAVKDGTVDKGADAAAIYEKAVQPWLNTMGEGPKNEDARRIQDFMMTDLIHNFMQGKPISNAQVKGDKKFKIVSERPVFAGTPPADMQMYGQMPPGFQGRPGGIPEGAGREGLRTPFSEIEMQEAAPPTPFSEPRAKTPLGDYSPFGDTGRVDERSGPPLPTQTQPQFFGQTPPTPFSEPRELAPVSTPYSPRIIEEEAAPPMPPAQSKMADFVAPALPPPTPFSEPEREYIPAPQAEEAPIEEEQPYIPRRRERDFISPFAQFSEEPQYAFADGGAIGEDYNFGFAGGGMPGEYAAGGKLLDGPGDGMSDDIPAVIRGKGVQRAALADGEFVIPADVVSHLGNGSTKAGAKKLYEMMARVRQARTGKTKQAPAVKTGRLLPV